MIYEMKNMYRPPDNTYNAMAPHNPIIIGLTVGKII